ncbi:YraN family protein [Brachybacterium sp. JHP9]|uniref:UPF0102 protein Bequi_01730 n=1 Tax=Brachybacterium equifaecis TaxID=2910770 RepID=A0ABT0QWV6_9MICO|nr:YraN family protein [Brachybacterium equifaecis]MCL6422121.1 YraN family protein [Brachybacterium equifaecis]
MTTQAPAIRLPVPLPVSQLTTRQLGQAGEDLIAELLAAAGWTVVDRNVRFRTGEIDIVAIDGWTLVFLEVKTRRTLVTGLPQASVTPQKLRRLRQLAGEYLLTHSPRHRDLRIDVVAVEVRADGTCVIEHLPGVF